MSLLKRLPSCSTIMGNCLCKCILLSLMHPSKHLQGKGLGTNNAKHIIFMNMIVAWSCCIAVFYEKVYRHVIKEVGKFPLNLLLFGYLTLSTNTGHALWSKFQKWWRHWCLIRQREIHWIIKISRMLNLFPRVITLKYSSVYLFSLFLTSQRFCSKAALFFFFFAIHTYIYK